MGELESMDELKSMDKLESIPARITAEWLGSQGFFSDQCKMFLAEWPDGCDSTEDNLQRALTIGIDLELLGTIVLPDSLAEKYKADCSAMHEDYQATIKPMYRKHLENRSPVGVNFKAACTALYDNYRAQYNLIEKDYIADVKQIDEAFDDVTNQAYKDYLSKRKQALIPFILSHYK